MTDIIKIKYIDLFCGLGAFHTAFNKCSTDTKKYECVYACDIDKNARNLYKENFNIKPEGDINKINIKKIPDFDILCAGFPCQPFSIAGKGKGFKDETKGNLFFKILEIIDKHSPDIVFLENVKNLYSIHKGETFKVIIKNLKERKYYISHKIIDSKYYGSPQSRKRIYIICTKDKPYVFEEIKKDIVPVSTIIDNTIPVFFEYQNKYELEKCKSKRNTMMIYKLINKTTKKGGRQGERIYSINNSGPTICAQSGGPGAKTGLYFIDNKIRRLSVKESLKMFGFDENYKYNSLKNKNERMLFHLGNSIVINVLVELIKTL